MDSTLLSSPHSSETSTICDVGGAHENQHEIASRFWSRSLKKSEKYDKELVDTWQGDADGILIFTGLFSTTVASFILESYKTLQRDSGDATVALLSQVTQQLSAISNGTSAPAPSPLPPFHASSSSIRINVLWFLSLCLSLTCALIATLMQQWSRNYLQMTQGQSSDPAAQARLRAFVFHGVSKFHMSHALKMVPLLLHISVFLFFVGMVEFLFPIQDTVAFVTLGFVVAMACTYALLTILPLACLNFPYSTPLSPLVWSLTNYPAKALSGLHWLVLAAIRFWSAYKWDFKHWRDALEDTTFSVPLFYYQFRAGLKKRLASQAVQAEASVLGRQLIWELDGAEDVHEIEAFFEGVHAALVVNRDLRPVVKYLVEHHTLLSFRFQCLFDSCDASLPEPIRHHRALVGVRALWDAFALKPEDHSLRLLLGAPFEGASAMSWTIAMAPLLYHDERNVAAAARCIQAILASNAVTKVLPEDAADLGTLATLVAPPPSLEHAVRDLDSLRANGGLIVLVNLLADLAAPLRAGGPLSEQIALIASEVVPWLSPPWELRGRIEPAVREAFSGVCEGVYALVNGPFLPKRPGTPSVRLSLQDPGPGPVAFSKLVEELRALSSFVSDEPQLLQGASFPS
ncbi:hypothetical protein BC834DRAFT_1034408 [Gloeopeniophorella convolvens]|nr:hypothetical protein BC834DRAFT_1034408 [Gloeopeniophorella convolvens]